MKSFTVGRLTSECQPTWSEASLWSNLIRNKSEKQWRRLRQTLQPILISFKTCYIIKQRSYKITQMSTKSLCNLTRTSFRWLSSKSTWPRWKSLGACSVRLRRGAGPRQPQRNVKDYGKKRWRRRLKLIACKQSKRSGDVATSNGSIWMWPLCLTSSSVQI